MTFGYFWVFAHSRRRHLWMVPKSCYLGISKIMKVYEKTTSVTKYAVHVTLYFHFFKIDAMKITLHY